MAQQRPSRSSSGGVEAESPGGLAADKRKSSGLLGKMKAKLKA